MKTLSSLWYNIQDYLFPALDEAVGELNEKQRQFVSVLELIEVGDLLRPFDWVGNGRKPKERLSLLKCFVAKSIYNMPQTKSFIDYLSSCPTLRRLCGFESIFEIPSEATFSRAFDQFSKRDIPSKIHEAMLQKHVGDHLFCHVSRDSSAIEAREKPLKKEKSVSPSPFKRGRPKKGENRPPKQPKRVEQQLDRSLEDNVSELPKDCDIGTKKNSKGHAMHWIGYKLHCDVVDGDIPVSAFVTSASLHDSQAAIPLAQMTQDRVTSLYDLMDAAYDSPEIHEMSIRSGHVPIIDDNPRKGNKKEKDPAKKQRFRARSSVERVYSNLKDNFAGKNFYVKGQAKVTAHLMFGIIALTATQMIKMIC